MIDWAVVVQAAATVSRVGTLAHNASGDKLDGDGLDALCAAQAKLSNSFRETRCAVRRRQWQKAEGKARDVLENSANLRKVIVGTGFDTERLDAARASLRQAVQSP